MGFLMGQSISEDTTIDVGNTHITSRWSHAYWLGQILFYVPLGSGTVPICAVKSGDVRQLGNVAHAFAACLGIANVLKRGNHVMASNDDHHHHHHLTAVETACCATPNRDQAFGFSKEDVRPLDSKTRWNAACVIIVSESLVLCCSPPPIDILSSPRYASIHMFNQ